MPLAWRRRNAGFTVLVCLLLHFASAATAAGPCEPASLPPRVAQMREAILEAAKGRDIEALREPIEWNELKPDFGAAGTDPIAHLKAVSGDGTGIGLLERLEAILEADCKAPAADAKDAPFVWPRLADARLDKLAAEDEELLRKLASPDEVKAMRAAGRWTGWRLAIGRDGTWHSLKKGD